MEVQVSITLMRKNIYYINDFVLYANVLAILFWRKK